MKLMGISRLRELSLRARDELDGAVGALIAELESGSWCSIDEVASRYPLATISGNKIQIPLGDAYRVDLLTDCELQMILIEYAGSANAGKVGSKAA